MSLSRNHRWNPRNRISDATYIPSTSYLPAKPPSKYLGADGKLHPLKPSSSPANSDAANQPTLSQPSSETPSAPKLDPFLAAFLAASLPAAIQSDTTFDLRRWQHQSYLYIQPIYLN